MLTLSCYEYDLRDEENLQVSPTWLHELRMEIVYLLHNMTRILTIS